MARAPRVTSKAKSARQGFAEGGMQRTLERTEVRHAQEMKAQEMQHKQMLLDLIEANKKMLLDQIEANKKYEREQDAKFEKNMAENTKIVGELEAVRKTLEQELQKAEEKFLNGVADPDADSAGPGATADRAVSADSAGLSTDRSDSEICAQLLAQMAQQQAEMYQRQLQMQSQHSKEMGEQAKHTQMLAETVLKLQQQMKHTQMLLDQGQGNRVYETEHAAKFENFEAENSKLVMELEAARKTMEEELEKAEEKFIQAATDPDEYDEIQNKIFQKFCCKVEEVKDVPKTRKPSMAVLGQAGVGKSSLINALAEMCVTPEGVVDTTTVVSKVHESPLTEFWDVPGCTDERSYTDLKHILAIKEMHLIIIMYVDRVEHIIKLEKFIQACKVPYLCVRTKVDQIVDAGSKAAHDLKKEAFEQEAQKLSAPLIFVSTKTGEGIDILKSEAKQLGVSLDGQAQRLESNLPVAAAPAAGEAPVQRAAEKTLPKETNGAPPQRAFGFDGQRSHAYRPQVYPARDYPSQNDPPLAHLPQSSPTYHGKFPTPVPAAGEASVQKAGKAAERPPPEMAVGLDGESSHPCRAHVFPAQAHQPRAQPPQTWSPQGYSQAYAPQAYAPQAYHAQAYPPHAHPQAYPPQAYQPQGYHAQAYPPHAHHPQAYPPQAYQPQGFHPQAQPPHGYPYSAQAYTDQACHPQAYPPQAYQPQGYHPQAQPSHAYPYSAQAYTGQACHPQAYPPQVYHRVD